MKRAIYIPLIERELPDLQFQSLVWQRHPPFSERAKSPVDLIISFDQPVDHATATTCENLFSNFHFQNIKVITANLTTEQAIYYRSLDVPGARPGPYGLKNGPNAHWLFNQRHCEQHYDVSFQCETDVVPLRTGWLDQLFAQDLTGVLISGAAYRGPSQLALSLYNHVNGNALHNHTHRQYANWLAFVENCLKDVTKKGQLNVAFDFAIHNYVASISGKDSWTIGETDLLEPLQTWHELTEILFSHHFTPLLSNISGGVELGQGYQICFDTLIDQYAPNAIAVHSSLFRYLALGQILERAFLLSMQDKSFLVEYARRLFPLGQREEIFTKFLKLNPRLDQQLHNSFLSWASTGSIPTNNTSNGAKKDQNNLTVAPKSTRSSPYVANLMSILPAPGPFAACFAFSLHKSGSTLLQNMVEGVAQREGFSNINIPGHMFEEGIPESEWTINRDILSLFEHGRVYHGFRCMPEALVDHDVTLNGKSILLLRDPRDALVSQYFSFGGQYVSHYIPQKSEAWIRDRISDHEDLGIDEYVIARSTMLLGRLMAYRHATERENWIIAKYEDVFFDKKSFLSRVFQHFELPVSTETIEAVTQRNDIRPDDEDPSRHIRKGRPGDHREKLKPETIEKLNNIFGDTCQSFGMQLS